MGTDPGKNGRDQALNFEGFLNNLHDWEYSLRDKDKKPKPRTLDNETSASSSRKMRPVESRTTGKNSSVDYSRGNTSQFGYPSNYKTRIPSSLLIDENSPDAASEKELGNEYFKQKKFREAIDCYSRSIALSPTAVAYANRAMGFLKLGKFQEAEEDCTEALNLDDRYIKAYSRRATARKELGKLKESIEDFEFALRLEPKNQEIKKQLAETKSLYQKEILQRASGTVRSSGSSGSQKTGTAARIVEHTKGRDGQVPAKTSVSVNQSEKQILEVENRNVVQVNGSHDGAVQGFGLTNQVTHDGNQATYDKKFAASIQQLASRAASRAMADAAKNITAPNSAYQFEVSWRALSGSCELQARLLKTVSPSSLPQIFKNALSAPMLIEIVKCVASFFDEETDLAVKYLDCLTMVARFDMIMMCLSSTDRADILKLWDEVFCGKATPNELAAILGNLRSRYCRG